VADEIKQRLGEVLVRANLIDEIQLRVALKEQRDSGERLGTTLVQLGFVDEAVLAAFLSKQTNLPCINIANIHIPPDLLKLIPKQLALDKAIVPIRRSRDTLYLAMADPMDETTVNAAQTVSGLTISPMIAPEVSLRKCLQRHYEPGKAAADEGAAELRRIVDELEDEGVRQLGEKVDKLSARVEEMFEALKELRDFLIPQG